MTQRNERLSEGTVTECLDALDWKRLRDHLEGMTLDEASSEHLIGLVLRSRSLVFRYPGKAARRLAIIDGVVAKIRADLGDNAADDAHRRLSIFEVIDEGYAGLREMISQLPLAAVPRAEMLSAYFGYVAKAWATLRAQVEEASSQPQTAVPGMEDLLAVLLCRRRSRNPQGFCQAVDARAFAVA